MAKKKRTPEQEAIRKAMRKPERWWNCNRHCAWVHRQGWGFFTNWRGFSFSAGKPKEKFYGPEVPESMIQITLDIRPFRFLVYWGNRRLV